MENYKQVGGYAFKLNYADLDDYYYDNDNYDSCVSMFCFHRKYNIGDKHKYSQSDFRSWDKFETQLKKDYDIRIIKPLYMYDHSGITISTSPFSCPWDSGQIGFAFFTAEAIRQRFGTKRITERILKRAERVLEDSVRLYDNFLVGNMFELSMCDSDGNHIVTQLVEYNDIDSVIDTMYSEYATEELVN
jgi:hypothetical protein